MVGGYTDLFSYPTISFPLACHCTYKYLSVNAFFTRNFVGDFGGNFCDEKQPKVQRARVYNNTILYANH